LVHFEHQFEVRRLIADGWPALGLRVVPHDDDSPATPAELARWAAVEASFHDRPVTDLAQAWVEEELRLIEAAESVKAWADAQSLAALRRLHEAVGMVVQEQADTISVYGNDMVSFAAVADETTTAAVDEVALATGMSEGQVAARLVLAANREERDTPLLAALAGGEVSLDRALRIHQATDGLDPDVARAVADRLLARMADGSVRSHRSFGRELRRQVVLHTADPDQARADAVNRRTSYGWLEPDGTGRLTVTGEASRVTAALDRVDGLARGLRSGGDSRTLEQLRSDLALDLLLYGWADPQQVPQRSAATFVVQPPPARVSLIVSLTTLLTLDDQPGEIPGHGFVPAAVARSIAGAGGSVWRRLVTDPLDGTALELSTTRYRPTREMAEQVAALDRMCQAPGCTVPAGRCDLDHEVPWPHGPTAVRNLRPRHRRHHNHKTRGTWKARPGPGGAARWTTVSGRDYLSHRFRYDDPLSRPVKTGDSQPPPF
jgi:hypothetical protein